MTVKFQFDPEDLRPLVTEIVAETLRQFGSRPTANGDTTPGIGLLDVKAAAKRLGIGTTKLRELTNAGDIPFVPIGRAVRYRPQDLDAYLDRNVQTRITESS